MVEKSFNEKLKRNPFPKENFKGEYVFLSIFNFILAIENPAFEKNDKKSSPKNVLLKN